MDRAGECPISSLGALRDSSPAHDHIFELEIEDLGNTYLNTYFEKYVGQETRRKECEENNEGGENQPRSNHS